MLYHFKLCRFKVKYSLTERQQTPGWRERCFCEEEKTNKHTLSSCDQCIIDVLEKSNKEEVTVIRGREIT